MLENKSRVQGPPRIGPRLGCLPNHQDRARDVIEAACHLPRARFEGGVGGDPLGERKRPVKRKAQAVPKCRRDQRGLIQQFLELGLKSAVGAALADGAGDDIERVDVAGAFPEHADMRIADQSRMHPFLDVAVAAANFHGAGRHRNVVAAGAEF